MVVRYPLIWRVCLKTEEVVTAIRSESVKTWVKMCWTESQNLSNHEYMCSFAVISMPAHGLILQWRHNERDGVSNHQRLHCLLNCWIKENIKAPRHWSLWGEFAGGTVNSPHKWPVTWKMFPLDDVIMLIAMKIFQSIASVSACATRRTYM